MRSLKSLNVIVLISVGLIGLALSYWVAKLQQHEIDQVITNEFERNASEWVFTLQQQIQIESGSVRAIGDLFAASNEVDRDEFQKFVTRVLNESTALQALEWLPRTPMNQVDRYLASLSAEGFKEVKIKPVNSVYTQMPGQGFDAHFPVHFVEPMQGNLAALAVDLTSEPKRAATMLRAAESRQFSLSPGLKLIQANENVTGLLGFWPIYEYGNRQKTLHGFALGVWRLDQLISATHGRFGPVGKNWHITISDTTHPDQRHTLFTTDQPIPDHRNQMQQTFAVGGRSWQIEIFDPLPANHWFSSLAWKFFLVGMAFTGLLIFYVASLLNRTHTVSKLVDERTAELNSALADLKTTAQEREATSQALAKQAEELAASNADLERFAYVASHDMKEPLRTIASYISLLKMDIEDTLTDETRKFMHFIQDGAKRLQQMIDDLLSYSRVGGDELVIDDVNLQDVVSDNLKALEDLIKRNDATITVGDLPTVTGDHSLLMLLMQNLMSNAIKFKNPELPPKIEIKAELQDNIWDISVSDNGLGISEKHQESIFGLFHRLHSRDDYEGTGLGLAICERIVVRHGGKIRVQSVPGEGSTFHFTLPAKN